MDKKLLILLLATQAGAIVASNNPTDAGAGDSNVGRHSQRVRARNRKVQVTAQAFPIKQDLSDPIAQYAVEIDSINDINSGLAVLGTLDAALLGASNEGESRTLHDKLETMLNGAVSKMGAFVEDARSE